MLGADEARLLQLFSLLQREMNDPAVAILADWLPPSAVRLAARVGGALAVALRDGALIVPLRHREAAVCHRWADAAPGVVLVH
jgi:hypothetical protein